MKFAGILVGFLGGWTIIIVIISALYADGKNVSMAIAIATVTPWTGLVAGGILTVLAGCHLYDKGDRQ